MPQNSASLLFVPHTESQPRSTWFGDQDQRPLHPRGLQQAVRLATAIGTVDAVYSSPSRRCFQTVEPLAAASTAPIVTLDELREATLHQPQTWDWWLDDAMRHALQGASVAGRVMKVIDLIANRHPHQRVALCSHGDTIPITIAHLTAHRGAELPAPINRGGWYEITDSTINTHGPLLEGPATP